MTVRISRDWATPLTVGSFLLLTVTGVLMFFHLDTGLNKLAHEWLSWVLLAAVGLHVASNWVAFRRHLNQRRGRWLIGAGALVLALSFLPASMFGTGSSEPPFVAPARLLAQVPLPVLAQVAASAGLSEEDLRKRLTQAGLPATGDDSIADRAGADGRRQVQVLARLLAPADAPAH